MLQSRHALCILVGLLSSPSPASASTYYVDGVCGNDAWTGLNPLCQPPDGPKATIQAGIDASIDGDPVIVADGTYTGAGNRDLDFAGRLITLRSANGPISCVIDCESEGRGFIFQNDETPEATVRGFMITHGAADDGGGVYAFESSPTIMNCMFLANNGYFGGGLANFVGQPRVINCAFLGNTAWHGGAVHNVAGNAEFINCAFAMNDARMAGGAIYIAASNPTVTNCTFTGNTFWWTTGHGGAIFNTSSDPVVTNCILWGNEDDLFGGDPLVTYSNVEGGHAGVGNINVDPRFVNAPTPGADGVWGTADDALGYLHLLPDSPCIDAGANDALPADIDTDADGLPRFLDVSCVPDTGDPGTAGPPVVDMGAYEVASEFLDCNDNGVADACDLATGSSDDCNANAEPDECEPDDDCNNNGVQDICDLASGASPDVNGDGVPDECESAEIIYVDDDGPGDPSPGDPTVSDPEEDGTTHHAFDSIQEAIDSSITGDVVEVADGHYTGVGNRAIDFGGRLITLRSKRGPENCVIDCALSSRGFEFVNGESAGAVLEGLAISNCRGGVRCSGTSPTIVDCLFRRNRTFENGGGIRSFNGDPTVINCRFLGNWANGDGGGVYSANGEIRILNCEFVGNVASSGAAVFKYSGTAALTNSTFSGNEAEYGNGASVYTYFGQLTASDCVLWGNHGNQIGGSGATARYCDVEGGFSGPGNIDSDPVFARDPDPGLDGDWGTDDDDYGDLRLQPDSPCIDAGDPAFKAETGAVDLDGHARVLCGRVDMGAYEAGIGDFDCDRDVDLFDFAHWDECTADVCEAFDFDADGDVDWADFGGFQKVFSGAP